MKPKAIYWRRKGKKIIAEGLVKGKTEYLFSLPDPEEFLRRIDPLNKGTSKCMKNPSFFNKEKTAKITQKLIRLDFKKKRGDIYAQ